MNSAQSLLDSLSINQVKYFISQYVWLIILGIAIISMIYVKPSHTTSEIHSATRQKPFNASENPTFFIHLTDVHVNSLKHEQTAKYQEALKVVSNLKPDIVITTGDLVDNWGTNPVWKYSKQYPPDHELYKNITFPVAEQVNMFIDMAGNHDEFALRGFDSVNHELLNYSYYFHNKPGLSYEDFLLTTEYYNDEAFIILNPIRYPSPHALFDFFAHGDKTLLDRIEKEIEKSKGYKRRILCTHYPGYLWDNGKSSSGKIYRKIIEDSDLDIVLTGHMHPDTGLAQHHGQSLEIIGSDTIQHQSVGIVTYDNGLTTYHRWDAFSPKKIVITNPCPSDQLSKKVVFNEENIDVRAIVFDDGADSVDLNVSGAITGKMEFVRRLSDNSSLYHIEGTFPKGTNKISISGFESETLEFFVGETQGRHYEFLLNFYNKFMTARKAFYILYPFFFVILFPVNIESFIPPLNDFACRMFRWQYEPFNTILDTIFATFFGFFLIRWRIQKLRIWVRIVLFVFTLFPFICPYSAMDTDGQLGNTNFLGYFAGGKMMVNVWGQIFSAVYTGVALISSSVLASFVAVSGKFHIVFIVDFLVCVACICVALYFENTYMTEACGTLYSNLSAFIFVPVLLISMLVLYRIFAGAPLYCKGGYDAMSGSVSAVML